MVPNNKLQRDTSIEKKSILTIDDCTDLLVLEKIVLEMEGYDVFTAKSGAEAFQVLARIDQPDLILLDVRMEDMGGPEFLDLLEEKMPEIMNTVPVVFLTAMDSVPKGRVAGFIRKPFDREKFLEAVHGYAKLKRVQK